MMVRVSVTSDADRGHADSTTTDVVLHSADQLNVHFDSYPNNPTEDTFTTFVFSAAAANVTYECFLDDQSLGPCSSPFALDVSPGHHTFTAHATDELGKTGDPSGDGLIEWTAGSQAAPFDGDVGSISGDALPDATLTATPSASWTGDPTFTYQWLRCNDAVAPGFCNPINGATGQTYTTSEVDIGNTIKVQDHRHERRRQPLRADGRVRAD